MFDRAALRPIERHLNLTRMGSLPWLTRIGGIVFGLGALGDVAHHAVERWLPGGIDAALGPDGSNAHFLTLIGMVVVVAGLIRYGLNVDPARGVRKSAPRHPTSCSRPADERCRQGRVEPRPPRSTTPQAPGRLG
jgi:hypothetical protein